MNLRFPDAERAALVAASLRAEGYFAEVADIHSSSLWGPVATSGVRVVVSRERIDDTDPSSEVGSPPGLVLGSLRMIVLALAVFGIAATAWMIAVAALANPVAFVIFLGILTALSCVALVLAAWVSMGSKRLMNHWRAMIDQDRFSLGYTVLTLLTFPALILLRQG